MFYSFILAFCIFREFILCPFMNEYYENGIMNRISVSNFIDTVLLSLSTQNKVYREHKICTNIIECEQ